MPRKKVEAKKSTKSLKTKKTIPAKSSSKRVIKSKKKVMENNLSIKKRITDFILKHKEKLPKNSLLKKEREKSQKSIKTPKKTPISKLPDKKEKKVLSNKKKFIFLFASLVFIASLLASYLYIFKNLPSPKTLIHGSYPVSTEIYDRNGKLLYQIYADQNRKPILLEQVPDITINATIAIEDKDFYKHSGFALSGILRAVYKNLFQGELQGGSTITQQLVKTALLTPERTLQRKLRELVLSSLTEIIYSKDTILELYLNHIPYGGTAYGIEQAAKLYFSKETKDLTLAESALLAGLPQAPSRYSPFGSTPNLAKERQKQVLARMYEDGYITKEEQKAAENEVLVYAKQQTNIKSPHFVLYVKDLLVEKYGQTMVEQGGLRVTTSLDYDLQEYTQASVSAEINSLKKHNVTNGSVLVTSPATGEILAMVGSRGYFDEEIDGNVNLTTSLRQPGSSIKPLNYALGLVKGLPASTIFLDTPTCFIATGQPSAYCPKNYNGGFHGPQQMRSALANSYNIPAVKMLALNGVKDFINFSTELGISTWNDPSKYGLSLTLGGGEVKMTDMAVAFGSLANSGIRIDLNPILKIETYKGEVLEEYHYDKKLPLGKKVMPPEVAYIISDILADNQARIPMFGAYSKLVIPGKTVAVKTGTTDDLRDNWTIGYTPEFVVTVWVGNNDNSKMNPFVVSGITGASPIWHSTMSYLLKNREDAVIPKPENVVGSHICNNPVNAEGETQICEGRFEYTIKDQKRHPLQGFMQRKNTWIDLETGRPPEEGKTENLELMEKLMVSDAFKFDYCLDCSHEGEKPTIVNLDLFYQRINPSPAPNLQATD
jgi:penicillin-binding protein 1C